MDFVGPFQFAKVMIPLVSYVDSPPDHLIPLLLKQRDERTRWYYIRKLVRLHGMPNLSFPTETLS